jgi:hypothetical protein
MIEAFDKLKRLIEEHFQFDRADLDFGSTTSRIAKAREH